ncbi:MAG: VanW family protein [Solirubrobacterales bacterium]
MEQTLVGGSLPNELEPVLDEWVVRGRRMPVNPGIERETGLIIPEVIGYEVDRKETLRRIFAAPPNTTVELARVPLRPLYTKKDLADLSVVIGRYETVIHGTPERAENIRLAAFSIHNRIIWPGEIFSFNQVVGPRTAERGYQIAPVIDSDTQLGLGGGVCQMSSTLYNAVLRAKLPIVQVHRHSKPVTYVPLNRDAAVVYGFQDFRFRNNRSTPIVIQASVSQSTLQVRIMGREGR